VKASAYVIGNDEETFKIFNSANVGCGFHAGDALLLSSGDTMTLSPINEVDVRTIGQRVRARTFEP